MTLSEKFKTSAEFIEYIEETFNIDVPDEKAIKFFEENKKITFTYTGILKQLKTL